MIDSDGNETTVPFGGDYDEANKIRWYILDDNGDKEVFIDNLYFDFNDEGYTQVHPFPSDSYTTRSNAYTTGTNRNGYYTLENVAVTSFTEKLFKFDMKYPNSDPLKTYKYEGLVFIECHDKYSQFEYTGEIDQRDISRDCRMG